MKKFTLFITATLLFTFLLFSAFGQKEYLVLGKKYSEAKIHKNNFKDLRVTSLELINDSTLTFTNKDTKKIEQLSTNNIRYLSVRKGSKALRFGLYGASVGALSVLAAVGDSNGEYKDDLGLRITMIIGGCGVIGAGIGALIPKWKRKYINKENHSTAFILYPGIYKNYYSLNLSITF